jgi:outer membrane receptor protein involved in Fe transport
VSYRPLPALTATIGLRYGYARSSDNSFAGSYYNYGASPYSENIAHAYPFTPKFALNYLLSDDVSLYANATKGFRLGGANIQIPEFECTTGAGDLSSLGLTSAPKSYGPDSLWSYEVGTKSSLFDNRVSIGLAAYYIDWKNVQQDIYLDTCGFDFNTNAGDAGIYGTDLEIHAKVTPQLTASATGSLTHDRLTSVIVGSGATVGEKLLGVPDWSATVGLDYDQPINDDVDGFARVDWDWTGHELGAFNPLDPDHDRPVYNVVNASIGAAIGDLEVSLYAKNLFDMGKTIQKPNLLSVEGGYTVRPLTVGLNVSKDF